MSEGTEEGLIAKWIKFRRFYLESMTLEERQRDFPECLEVGYDWEATGIRDYIRLHLPEVEKKVESTYAELEKKYSKKYSVLFELYTEHIHEHRLGTSPVCEDCIRLANLAIEKRWIKNYGEYTKTYFTKYEENHPEFEFDKDK